MGFTPRTAKMSSWGGGNNGDGARPMTSVRAAGFSSRGRSAASNGNTFDPFNQAGKIVELTRDFIGRITPDKPSTAEQTPEEMIKSLEKKVNFLIEESAFAAENGDFQLALDKAKDAGKKERQLAKQREQLNMGEQANLD